MPTDDDTATYQLRLGDAMEFLTTKDYADNWLSECHESFCGLSFADWRTVLTDAGFTLDPTSAAWRNEWLAEHRFSPWRRWPTPGPVHRSPGPSPTCSPSHAGRWAERVSAWGGPRRRPGRSRW
ncbi:hypothetical protein [Nocardioides zeae]